MSHIKRGGNKPVHMLAKYAIRIGSFVTWVKENPVIFKSASAQDVLNLFHLNKVTCLFINQKKKNIYIYIGGVLANITLMPTLSSTVFTHASSHELVLNMWSLILCIIN